MEPIVHFVFAVKPNLPLVLSSTFLQSTSCPVLTIATTIIRSARESQQVDVARGRDLEKKQTNTQTSKQASRTHTHTRGEEARRGEVVFYVTRYLYYLPVHRSPPPAALVSLEQVTTLNTPI